MKLSSMTTAAAEAAGKWFVYEPGVRVRISPARNPQHRDWLIARARSLSKAERKDSATLLLIDAEGIARNVLRDWEGITDDAGVPVPYTPELGVRLLTAGTARANDFKAFVDEISTDPDAFAVEGAAREGEAEEAAATFRGSPPLGS